MFFFHESCIRNKYQYIKV